MKAQDGDQCWQPLHPAVKALALHARRSPAHPAKVRILKLLAASLPLNAWIYLEPRNETRFLSVPSDFIGWEILTKGCFEPESLALCRRLLEQHGGWFADVGAHHGLFSCTMSAMRDMRVLSFEPNPASFLRLRDNVRRNNRSSVHLVHAAVAAESCLVPWRHAGGDGGTTAWSHATRAGEQSDYLVPAVPFCGVVSDLGWGGPTVVKMDVEGAELSALAGFDFDAQRPRFILMEAEPLWPEKSAFMSARGYSAFGEGGHPLGGEGSQPFLEGNALFVDDGLSGWQW